MCDCIEKIDAELAGRNTRIRQAFVIGSGSLDLSGALIQTEQVETGRGKEKAVNLHATFCPFCGVHYEEKASADAS